MKSLPNKETISFNNGISLASFVADDGFTSEAPLADIQACTSCIVAFDEGAFRSVMPDFPGNLQVKGLTEIQVK